MARARTRIARWSPTRFDAEFGLICIERLREGADLVAQVARELCPRGTISRPMYKSGPYAGQSWTARDAGSLRKTIRVVEKWDQWGVPLAQGRDVWVMAGNYNIYYAKIVEYYTPFMRPALNRSIPMLKTIFGISA